MSSTGFFATFAVVRVISHAIRAGIGPFHNVVVGETHLHHLVWGILLLLLVGYLWLVQVGTENGPTSRWISKVAALLYGVGAALTLDECALWVNLEDVYWAREGRLSINAVMLFGALLSSGLWGSLFLRALARKATYLLRGLSSEKV